MEKFTQTAQKLDETSGGFGAHHYDTQTLLFRSCIRPAGINFRAIVFARAPLRAQSAPVGTT